MQETETKIELTAGAFDRLLAHCTIVAEAQQLNVYYDCAGALAQRSGSFRIRYVTGELPVMTLKLPIRRQHGRRVSLEVEEQFAGRVPPRVFRVEQLSPPFRLYLQEICDAPVRRLGAMRNQRRTVRLPGGEQIELDRVTLPGGVVFHEVEIESDDPAVHAYALAAVRAIAPDCRFSRRGKFQRFRHALKRLGG